MNPLKFVDARLNLIKKLDELEDKMDIPIPSKDVINQINSLSKEIKESFSSFKKAGYPVSLEERRYNYIITKMNKEWPRT